mmetsp:Transcript_24770/g.36739  ORF Transcript_24770/g.36739 Transcript_24770/m.36739 type:complete len:283 (-) Transcript_24770:82-930(-)
MVDSEGTKKPIWLNPQENIAELMKKDEKAIIAYVAGNFTGCVIRSGTTAVLAANSVLKILSNPDIVKTGREGAVTTPANGRGFAKIKESIAFLGETAGKVSKYVGKDETLKETVSSAAEVTNELISASAAMAALGLKIGDNIRAGYVNAKKAKEEARLKAEKEAEEARKAEEERRRIEAEKRRIEAERLELERKEIEKIRMKAEEEKKRIRSHQLKAAMRALEKIQNITKAEEIRIEKEYAEAINMVKGTMPMESSAGSGTDAEQKDPQTDDLSTYFIADSP